MRISPVMTYPNQYQYKEANTVKNFTSKLCFKSAYSDAFTDAFTKKYSNVNEAKQALLRLNNAVQETFHTSAIYNFYSRDTSLDVMLTLLNGNHEIKSGNKTIVHVYDRGIVFYDEDSTPESYKRLEFSKNAKYEVAVTQDFDYGYDEYTFWNSTGNLAKYKHSSGTGLGQVTDTTYYDANGNVLTLKDRIKNFFK